MIIKCYFIAYFAQKQTKRKFPVFDQNHGLTAWKKPNMASVLNQYFSLGGLVC